MQNINNEYWNNAKIYVNHDLKIHPNEIPAFYEGIWYYGLYKKGYWYGYFWLSGDCVETYVLKDINSSPPWILINFSPKSYYKPKLTLSLNYAKYI